MYHNIKRMKISITGSWSIDWLIDFVEIYR